MMGRGPPRENLMVEGLEESKDTRRYEGMGGMGERKEKPKKKEERS